MATTRSTPQDAPAGPAPGVLAVLVVGDGTLRSSREAGPLLGLREGEVPRDVLGLLELVHADDRARAAALLESSEPFEEAWRLARPDGSTPRVVVAGRMVGDQRLLVLRELGGGEEAGPALFRRLADTVPVLIWVSDPWGGLLFLNEAWTTYTGRPPEEQLGDGWLEAVHPEDRDRVARVRELAHARQERFEVRYRVLRHDGAYRWLQDRGLPYHAADGSPAGWVGGVVDVHQREGELARADLLAEAGAALEASLDEDVLVRGFVEALAGRLAAWARVELLVADGPDDVVAAGEGSAGEPARRVDLRAGGRRLGVLALGPPVDGSPGIDDPTLAVELGRRAGLALDHARLFHRARRQQRASEEARATLDALVRGAPVGFARFDASLRFVSVNEAMAAMHGVPADEHVGRTIGEVLPEMDPAVERDLRRVLATGEALTEVAVTGATPARPGRRRSFLASMYRVELPDGETLGLGLTLVDVTGRIEAEGALRAQRDLYEALLRAQSEAGEAFVLLEGDRLLYVNEAAERIAARTAEELYALPSLMDIVAPADRSAFAGGLGRVQAGGLLPHGSEIALVRPSGALVTIEVAARAMAGETDRRMVVLARDVSERKRAEAERERLLDAERRAREETEAARSRAAFLAEVSGVMERSLSIEEGLGAVTELLARDVCDTTSVWAAERDGWLVRCHAAATRHPDRRELVRSLAGRVRTVEDPHPACQAMQTGTRLAIDRLDASHLRDSAADPDDLRRLVTIDPRSALAIPLIARGRTVGALVLAWDVPSGWPTDPERAEQLEELARRVGLFVDNAQLYAERAHIASTLQASLLPPALPTIDGLEVAARYLPAGEAAEVGGDFYDVFRCGDDGWAFVVGDVCGKGTEAAALTAMARYTLRAATADDGSRAARPAAHAFEVLNRTMLAETVPDRFLTAVMGVLYADPASPVEGGRVLRMALAGHPAPIVLRPGREPQAVEASGTLLGVRRDAAWREVEVRLAPGDALVLYTDGVTEADRRDPLEAADLAALLRAAGDATTGAAGLADVVRELAEQRAGGPLRDDVAIVALRLT